MYSRAGSSPPITSTTRSLRATMSSNSPRLLVSTPEISGRIPTDDSMEAARSSCSWWKADPTAPWPSRPTLNVTDREVLVALAAHHDAGVAVAAEDHGRARDPVVVVRHGVAVGAGGGDHE